MGVTINYEISGVERRDIEDRPVIPESLLAGHDGASYFPPP